MRIIQVVGTNGKGSTVAFVEAILRAHGISCGLFTSPHLSSATERIRINGRIISQHQFVEAARRVLMCAENMPDEASFFECVLAMAMWLFQQQKISVAILEAGLGGRLDATTALMADILGIAMIDYDHQNILGHTITEIAAEKIFAAYPLQNVVTVEQRPDAMKVINDAQTIIGFNLSHALRSFDTLGLMGDHQQINAGLAKALVAKMGLLTSEDLCRQGLLDVNWPARFEIIDATIPLIVDGAHNPAGINALITTLQQHPLTTRKPITLVYGSLASDHAEEKIRLLKASTLDIRSVYLHQSRNHRALSVNILKELFVAQGFCENDLHMFDSCGPIIDSARQSCDPIIICGSLYSVGEIRAELLGMPVDEILPRF